MLMRKGKIALLILALAVVAGTAAEPSQQTPDTSKADTSGRQVLTPSLERAKKDFKIGEFFRLTGHRGAARFFYKFVQRRHPNTKYAKLAAERMQQLKPGPAKPKADDRPPAFVGQIFVIGNTKQGIILETCQLYPGAVLRYPALQQAERSLRRLGIFKDDPANGIRPTVTVMDPNDDSPYKDILIQVKEKK